eukprot:264879_1
MSYFTEQNIDGQLLFELKTKNFCNEIATYCNDKRLVASAKKLLKALKEFNPSVTMNSYMSSDINQCNASFVHCKSSIRIKNILEQYNIIIMDKDNKTDNQTQNDVYELINNKAFNG